MGGAGSGKSVAAAQKILLRLKSEPDHRFLVVRKVGTTIRDSVYRLFNDLIDMYDLHSEFTVLKSEFKITHKSGNEILFYGLDDPEKIKSIAGVTGIWVEESTELEREDFYQLNLRLRGETKNYKQIVCTLNPIKEDHWIKEEFFDKEDPEIFTLVTTYKDNAFLDEQYKQELEVRYKSDENMYRVYVLGMWGKITAGNAFYKNFNFSKHVRKIEYNPDLPICLTWDFNVNPYCTTLVAQVEEGTVRFIDEICLKHPNNTILDNCKTFIRRYGDHKAGLLIFGDVSGRQQDEKYEKGFNNYTVIAEELKKFNPALRVPSKNPNIIPRAQWLNNVFMGLRKIEIQIDERCKQLINDLTYTAEAETGEKHKTMFRDKATGTSYQKYGHASDAFDYICCQVFSEDFTNYRCGGDRPAPLLGRTRTPKRW
jgi:phage terminase large subunit